MKIFHVVIVMMLLGGISALAGRAEAEPDDPWRTIQDFFPTETEKLSVHSEQKAEPDPWLDLQEYFIPFTEQQEIEALTNRRRAVILAGKLHQRLYPFRAYIALAAERFQVPPEIIGAVIMVESSGNPKARAKTSSAKGLMQTIHSTFVMARKALAAKGIHVADSAYNAQASIMTGSWYLGQMFDQAVRDGRVKRNKRDTILHWKLPVEYYYAGPGHGKKKRDIVIIYSGGKRVVIDKPAYSQKVLRWAKIMAVSTAL
jgi:hypothetical protein